MQALGIDIGDSHITGVVLAQRGRHLEMRGCGTLPLADRAEPAETIRLLCEQLDWREGVCVCGLPLSLLSVRNLTLPFQDAGKIAQVLPFELEEQLLVPVETLITDFSLAGKNGAGTAVVAFSLEKSWLRALLDGLQGVADPDMVTPAMASLAVHLARQDKNRSNFLVVHVNLYAGSLALVLDGKPALFRRLAYPEEMILRPPFRRGHDQVEIVDPEAAAECVRLLCRSIERSLDYFRMEYREEGRPERIVLTGPLAQGTFIADAVEADLGLPVERIDLLAANALACSEEVRGQWRGHACDRALALALQGFRRTGINFRKEAFARKRPLFSSRKQLLAAVAAGAVLVLGLLGFLGYDYRRLQQRDAATYGQMVALYKETFPEVTRVQDPMAEMRARLQSAQGPASPALFLHGEQRVLGLLADISARIPETVTLRVNRLSIDRDVVMLRGTTDTFNAVQTIKSTLAASPRFKSVQIVSATADKERKTGAVRFEIQLQLQGL
ncbi:type II secretion system protein GspL [Desulfobulbus elongatus]|uniref:type II secretion system protein GspL n=1 Tax=Desulfobulbus elongatus TaxID=53332 RepID=UPI0004875D96|nr:type II secretion system protein GspL [Desulfobulbus elongatus]